MFDLQNTRITIRERSTLDVLDLAFRLWGVMGRAMLVCAALGVIPFFMLNVLLGLGVIEFFSSGDELAFDWNWLLVAAAMPLVIAYQSPLAMSFLTIYLGESCFKDRVSPREVLKRWFTAFPQMCYWFLLPVPTRLWSFFLPEIVLLERTPRRVRANGFSTAQRNRIVNRYDIAEGMSRPLLLLIYGFPAAMGIFGASWFLYAQLAAEGATAPVVVLVFWQGAFWLLAAYAAVVRFLAYLNARIHCEGWEIELAMRAEAERLRNQFA